jgi:hypothetical protein
MCIAFLIIAKYCDTCFRYSVRGPSTGCKMTLVYSAWRFPCVDLNSLRNIRYPAEWTGVNVSVVFRMKIKINKSRISLLTSGIICLNLLKNKIFKIKIWSLASENTWKISEIYFSHNILRFAHQKWQTKKREKKLTFLNHLLALDNVFSTKSEEQEVNLVWPNLFSIFDCPSSVYTARDHDLFRTLSKWISVDIKIIGQVCLRGSELKKSYI